MSEVKRISLKTVSNISNNNNNNNNNNNSDKSENNKKSKDNNKSKDNKEPKTKRIVLELNNDCNEFSFNDLIKPNNDKNGEQVNGLNTSDDPLADNEEEYKLRQLEKSFKEKYGPKKGRHWEDYVDKGQGYDETDPFIDNEEAYDELVPSTLTTRYGGFYINCGELEFRPLSPDENDHDEDEDNIRPVLKRKRKLELESGKRRRSSTELNRKSRKNKTPSPGKQTVAQMLQQKKGQTSQNDNSNQIEEIEINDSNSSAEVVVSASVRDVVDFVAKGEGQPNGEEKNGSAGSSDAEDLIKKDYSIPAVKLPDGLPQDLCSTLEKIKKLAHTSHDGKRNFFTPDVNKMLYDIESKTRELPPSQRTLIYSHLASHLPCTKQTLMSRAKKALFENIEYSLQTSIANMVTIVKRLQPEVIKKYQKTCEELKAQFDRNKQNGLIATQTELKYPRKIFPWNEKLKSIYTEAVSNKIYQYDQLGTKNQTISLKDSLDEFLDKEIKPIWPKGWMSLEILKHKAKWVKGILPPEQQPLQHLSQSDPQSSHSAANHLSPQIILLDKVNKVQSQAQQQSSQEKSNTNKVQPFVAEKPSKTVVSNEEKESIELKLPSNTIIKSLSSTTYHKMNDHMSEGLVSKFIPAVKEVKDNVNNSDVINLTTIDLSTKARSSPKPLSTPSVRTSPINLKTSPNITVIKSNSPSPSVSPLAMTSILQSSKHEKLTREACLTKVIEQTLGDYPNSASISSLTSQRNTKLINSLPQTPLPIADLLSKSFNSSPAKDSKSEICIEIASSPEPYKKVQQYQQQSHQTQHQTHQKLQQQTQNLKSQILQQKSITKHLSTTSIPTQPTNQLTFQRNSEMVKKKTNTNTLIQTPNSTQKDAKDYRQSLLEMNAQHLLLQAQMSRNTTRDTSISITPIPQKPSENSSNSNQNSRSQSNPNSRYVNSSSAITSTTSSPMNLTRSLEDQYLRMWAQITPNIPPHVAALVSQNPHLFTTTSNSQNHSLYYPYNTTTVSSTTPSHPTGESRGRTN